MSRNWRLLLSFILLAALLTIGTGCRGEKGPKITAVHRENTNIDISGTAETAARIARELGLENEVDEVEITYFCGEGESRVVRMGRKAHVYVKVPPEPKEKAAFYLTQALMGLSSAEGGSETNKMVVQLADEAMKYNAEVSKAAMKETGQIAETAIGAMKQVAYAVFLANAYKESLTAGLLAIVLLLVLYNLLGRD